MQAARLTEYERLVQGLLEADKDQFDPDGLFLRQVLDEFLARESTQSPREKGFSQLPNIHAVGELNSSKPTVVEPPSESAMTGGTQSGDAAKRLVR